MLITVDALEKCILHQRIYIFLTTGRFSYLYYNVLSAALPFDGATFSYKKNFRFFFTTTLWSFRSQFFSGECFLVGFDDVREKRPVDNFLGLYEEKKKKKKMRGAVYMCPVCFFSFGRRGFLFFTAQRCVVYSYSIHLICAHLSYMRIIKQLRRKVRK